MTTDNRNKLLHIGLATVLVLLLTLMVILSEQLRVAMLRQAKTISTVITQLAKEIPFVAPDITPKPITSERDRRGDMYALQHLEGDKIATVAALFGNNTYAEVWQNYLLYADFDASNGARVQAKNLTTLDTTPLFLENADSPDPSQHHTFTDFKVINNSLVFSLGGYLMNGIQYVVSLPPREKARQFASVNNGVVIPDWFHRLWVIGGEGDACWGMGQFYTVDPSSWVSTKVADTRSGCTDGEDLIGIDTHNRMILGGHTAATSADDNQHGTYTYVISIDIDNPALKEGIIAKQNMPADIVNLSYDNLSNALIMSTKTKSYIYQLDTKETTQSANLLETKQLDWPVGSNLHELKAQIDTMSLPDGYRWQLIQPQ